MHIDHTTTPLTNSVRDNYVNIREVVDACLGDPQGRSIEVEISTDPAHPDASDTAQAED